MSITEINFDCKFIDAQSEDCLSLWHLQWSYLLNSCSRSVVSWRLLDPQHRVPTVRPVSIARHCKMFQAKEMSKKDLKSVSYRYNQCCFNIYCFMQQPAWIDPHETARLRIQFLEPLTPRPHCAEVVSIHRTPVGSKYTFPSSWADCYNVAITLQDCQLVDSSKFHDKKQQLLSSSIFF